MTSGAVLSLERLVALAALAGAEPPGGALSRGAGAGIDGRRRGDGGDPYDLRPFVDGDDPRLMDPAATARSGRPQLRRRHEQVERCTLLAVDFRSPMLWGTRGRFRSVAAAEAAVLEGWRAVLAGGRTGLAVLRDGGIDWLPARPREAAMLEIAAMLARTHAEVMAQPAGTSPTLAGLLPEAAARSASGTEILLATGMDLPGDAFAATLAALARRNRIQILLVQDAVEAEPPAGWFTVRLGGRMARGRFGASQTAADLEAEAVPVRIVRADRPETVAP
ncbi:DUF58 domain-containing protein [Poseidonocella sp. HB161398]|uniref:DUF58 domain-containing protein n=1 Tax=Poseidonocella sp. HB161398 TaxID=2320855 RepID=UPI001F0E4860|nr:DUF58 domain-containing protein [Poseidonocella sp. HB161398]